MPRRHRRNCALLVFLLCIFRLSFFALYHERDIVVAEDSRSYLHVATNLWTAGTFGYTYQQTSRFQAYAVRDGDRTPDAIAHGYAFTGLRYPLDVNRIAAAVYPSTRYVVPGYSAFLAPFSALREYQIPAAVCTQIVLGALAGVIVFSLAYHISGAWAAYLAFLFYASYIPLAIRSATLLTESLTVSLLLCGLLLTDKLLAPTRSNRRHWLACTAGAIFALLAHVRIVMLPLPLVTGGFLIAARGSWRERAVVVALGILSFLVCFSPWPIRNYVQFENESIRDIVARRSPGLNGLSYWQTEFMARGYGLWESRVEFHRRSRNNTLPERDASLRTTVRHSIHRLGILFGLHPSQRLPFPFAGTRIGATYWVGFKLFHWIWNPLLLIGVAGASIVAARHPNVRLLHCLVLPAALLAIYAFVHAIPRYQVVPYAVWCIPAGVGWSRLVPSFLSLLPRHLSRYRFSAVITSRMKSPPSLT